MILCIVTSLTVVKRVLCYIRHSPARWKMAHWKGWDEIPGVALLASQFLWSVVPAGMESGGEKARDGPGTGGTDHAQDAAT
jgi:hypothetical protein